MSCDVSLVLVAHQSSGELSAAVSAFRREAAANGLAAEVVVVEQSEDEAEEQRAARCQPEQLLVRPNRGYAAGVNAGIAAARGRRLLVANPDTELGPGALAPLLAALDSGWGVVGPQFELAGFLFPPAEVQTPAAEAARRLALRHRHAWERHMRSEMARASAVWDAESPRAVPLLSGALLAFSAALATRIGEWDEDYFLYFEETDWLRRARRAGARLAVVPASRAAHRWGHSARPEAWADRFGSSQERYFRRWFPLLGPWALRLRAWAAPAPRPWSEAPRGGGWRWLLSPSPTGFPAARLDDGRSVEAATAELCRVCRRPSVTLTAWLPAAGRFAGPFFRRADE